MKNSKKPTKKSAKAGRVSKKSSPKKSKKEVAKPEPMEPASLVVVKTSIEWDDSYPFLKESCKVNGRMIDVPRYISASNPDTQAEFEKFLFDVVRSNNLPNFVRNSFKKVRKMLEKEIQYRLKTAEKLNREQGEAFKSFFKDPVYFDYSLHSEYFEHEMEKVFTNYLKAYCATGMYESRVRIGNRKRKEILEKLQSNG